MRRFRMAGSLVGLSRFLFLALAAASLGIACSDEGPGGLTDSPARILSFSATPAALEGPGDVTISWSTSGAATLSLTGNGAEVSLGDAPIASGSVTVLVEEDTTFELVASNTAGKTVSETRTVTVTLIEVPAIGSFTGPEMVGVDELGVARATLSWAGIVRADEVTLEANPGSSQVLGAAQIPSGSVEVELTEDTTFTLVARNEGGEVSREVAIQVIPMPVIVDFDADRTWVGTGESVTLSWTTTGVVAVELWVDGVKDDSLDPALVNGSHPVPVAFDSGIELRAYNAVEAMVSSSLDVQVAQPELTDFTASASSLWFGEDLHFTWTSEGASSFLISAEGIEGAICETSDLAEVASGSCDWSPPVGTYVISGSAINASGVSAANRTVTIGTGPQITAFTVSPEALSLGDELTVTWATLPDPAGTEPTLTLSDNRGNTYALEGAVENRVRFPMEAGPGEVQFKLVAATNHALSTSVEATASVTVHGLPFATLTVTPPVFDDTQTADVALSWTSEYASGLTLYRLDEGEPVPNPEDPENPDIPVIPVEILAVPEAQLAAGEYRFIPTHEATYQLIATSPMGLTFTADAFVAIAPPEVLTFTADKTSILFGEPVQLTWTTKMARDVSLSIFGSEYVRGETQEPFVDISQMGTHLPLTTDCSTSHLTSGCVKLVFPDGFTFPFDGKLEPQVRVHNNGFLSFEVDRLSSTTSNQRFPTSSTYGYAHIAPFWDALGWDANRYPFGNIYYHLGERGTHGRSLTIQWKNVTVTSGRKARLNFQVVLWEDGRFEFRYADMEPGVNRSESQWGLADGRGATIGYQTASQSSSDVMQYNTTVNIWGRLSHRTFSYDPAPSLEKSGSYLWYPFPTNQTVPVTLEASRGDVSDSETLSVQMMSRPSIVLTDPPTEPITVGTSFRIGWETENATSLVLLDEAGTTLCTAADQIEVAAGFCEITETVEDIYTYTIRVVGTGGVVLEKPFEVFVYEPFSIESFTIDQTILEQGEPLTLSWNTENAKQISLLANGVEIMPPGTPSGPGSMVLPGITVDTTFVLRVTNSLGMFEEATQKVTTWKVRLTMTPSATKVRPGEPVTITINAESLDGGPTPEIYGSFPLIDVPNPPAYSDITLLPGATELQTRPSNPDFPFPQTYYGDLSLPSGFSFPYFGESFSTARVYAHGVVSFASDTDGNVNNQILPSTSTAYRSYHLAPFWDNLQARGPGAGIWTAQPDPDTFIIQWTKFSGTTGSSATVEGVVEDRPYNLNFQVVLFRNGTFEYRYGAMDPPANPGTGCQPASCANEANGSSATIGYHARRGMFGTTHHFGGTGNAVTNLTYPGGMANRVFRYQPVPNGGQMTFNPVRTSTYTICAMSGSDLVCKNLTIDASFGIGAFTVDSSSIVFSDSTTLRWTTTGGTRLRILDGDGQEIRSTTDPAEIDAGVLAVTPMANTRYTLELTGPYYHATATAFVEVVRLRMEASGPKTSHPGDPVTLSWTLTNADPNLHPVIATPMVETTGPGNLFSDMDIRVLPGVRELEARSGQTTATHTVEFDEGFTFEYLGRPMSSVRVHVAGILSFSSSGNLASGNTELPSSGTAAQKLTHLAPFWDTLNTRESGRIYAVQYDPDTFVIQWNHMSLSAGSSTTDEYDLNFMVILRKNGDFEFRYGVMNPPLASTSGCTPVGCWHEANGSMATIGYSDPNNQAGFTLNYGSTASDMKSIPGGLSNRTWKYTKTTAATGTVQVAPWSTTVYRICAVDSATGDVECSGPVDVEVKYGITGFDATPWAPLAGEPVTLVWDVKGMDRLRLLADGDVLFDQSGSSVVPIGTFSHTPNKETLYTLEGTSAGRVMTAERTVQMRTFTFDYSFPPGRYFPGDEVTISWNIVQQGTGDLTVLVPLNEIDAGPGQPGAYQDISGVGTEVTMSSTNGFATRTIPFPFPYFGENQTEFSVYVDGYISFDTAGSTGVGANTILPNSGTSQRRIHLAPFWDDLFMRDADSVWMHSPTPDSFIVQWKNFNRSGGSSSTSTPPAFYDLNFQVVFYANGTFEYRYGRMAPPEQPSSLTSCHPSSCELEANGSSATIGYQSTDGLLGHAMQFGGSTAATVVPIEGGLENRSFRFEPRLSGSSKARVSITTDHTMCATMQNQDGSVFEECKTVTIRPVANPGDLTFTELMINPVGGASQQWFEVRNLTRAPIDLMGFKLRGTRGEHTIANSLPVAPGGLVVFASSAGGGFTPDHLYGADITLHHEVDTLELIAGTSTIATASWDGSWTVPSGTSLSLDSSFHIKGTISNPFSSWCTMSADPPSPGTLGVGCQSSDYDVDVMGTGTYYDLTLIGQPLREFETTSAFVGLDLPGFSFPFFDGVVENVWVAANGWVSFSESGPTSGSASTPSASGIPRSGTGQPPGPLVAGFWATLRCNNEVHDCAFRYHYGDFDGKRALILDWNKFRYSTSIGGISFQIQLWEDGDIKVVFDEVWSADALGSTGNNNYFGNTSATYLEGPERSTYLVGNHRRVIELDYRTFHFKRKL